MRAGVQRGAVPSIYPIVDHGVLGDQLIPALRRLLAAGAAWVQLRAKGLPDRRLLELLRTVCELAAGAGAAVWINDRPDLAALTPVAGVHLGQDDLPPAAARKIVGPDVWIGRSTHSAAQIEEAAADPAVDLLAVGPIFATSSKSDAEPVVGPELVARARRVTGKPLIAVGGLDEGNVKEALVAGADGAAVIGAISQAPFGDGFRALVRAAEGRA